MAMEVHIVVRGNAAVGVGHILRCITLAKQHKRFGAKVFMVTTRQSLTAAYCREQGEDIYLLDASTEEEGWADYLIALQKKTPNILWLDLLEPDLRCFAGLSCRSSLRPYVASLSSFPYRIPRFEDVTFYPSMAPLSSSVLQGDDASTVVLSGPEYFIIRPEFLASSPKTFDAKSRKILVTMGGADPGHFVSLVVRALEILPEPIQCRLLLGRASQNDNKLDAVIGTSKHEYVVCRETIHMAEWMTWADVAIINGGMTRYELAVAGTPFIAISLHQAQWEITEQMASRGLCVNLGVGGQLRPETIRDALSLLLGDVDKRRHMSVLMRQALDGQGARRMVEYVMERVKAGGLCGS